MGNKLYIAVVGPGRCGGHEAAVAKEVGALLARRGAVVVCGGKGGVMEAVARGARREGGTVLGILPGADHGEDNAYLSLAVPTGLGEARNALIVRAADGVIAVGGGFGTLSEIALALRAGKPVVGLNSWRLVPPEGGAGGLSGRVVEADGPAAAVETVIALVGDVGRAGHVGNAGDSENGEPRNNMEDPSVDNAENEQAAERVEQAAVPSASPERHTVEVTYVRSVEGCGEGRWHAVCPAFPDLEREAESFEAVLTDLSSDILGRAGRTGRPADLDVRIGATLVMHPETCGGRVHIAETEISVALLLEMLAAEDSVKALREHYPILGERDITAALEFATRVVGSIRIPPAG